MTQRPQAGFIPALDGLRGIAIILVMLHHFTYYRPTSGIDALIASVLFFFWTGVDLFFVLSGFLITGILLDTRGNERYFTNFYARRTLRIFPLYYLVLFLAFVVLPKFPAVHAVLAGRSIDLPPQWPYWLYLTNFSIADRGWVHGWVDVAWSLAIEEQFYLVWPLVIWLCPPRLVVWLCTAIFVAEVFARSCARASDMPVLPIYVVTWFRLDGLVIGALLAVALRRGIMPELDRLAPVVVIVGVAGLIAVTIHGRPYVVVESADAAVRLLTDRGHRGRDVGQCHQPAGRQPVAADAVRGMAARLRQIQLLLVPDSPAGHARRPRVRLQPGGVPDARDCAVDRPGAVLRRSGRAGIRAGVAVVAVLRGADSQTEGAVSVLTCQRVVAGVQRPFIAAISVTLSATTVSCATRLNRSATCCAAAGTGTAGGGEAKICS